MILNFSLLSYQKLLAVYQLYLVFQELSIYHLLLLNVGDVDISVKYFFNAPTLGSIDIQLSLRIIVILLSVSPA